MCSILASLDKSAIFVEMRWREVTEQQVNEVVCISGCLLMIRETKLGSSVKRVVYGRYCKVLCKALCTAKVY